MTQFINPEYSKPTLNLPAKKWSLKYGYFLLIAFLVIILAGVIFLLIREYYGTNYRLMDLLPKDYALAVEFNNNEESLPKIQAKEFLNQPLLQKVYQTAEENINGYLTSLPQEIEQVIKTSKHFLFFLPDEKSFGLIIELADKKEAEKINIHSSPNLNYQIIKKQILVITSNPELLEKITTRQIQPLSPFNLSFSLTPWLTFYLQDEFFKQTFENNILADMQTILLPLESTDKKSFQLEFLTKPHQLILNLKPSKLKADDQLVVLDDYLDFLPQDYDLLFGLNDLSKLTAETEKNNILKNYFIQADSLLWLKTQNSLSRLTKELSSPLIVYLSNDKWQILTNSANLELFDGLLKNYLAEFKPVKRTVALPDNTKAVELITNPSSITWEMSENDGWQLYKFDHKQSKIGYGLKENILIISNQIENFKDTSLENGCILPKVSAFLSISGPNTQLFNSNLQNFAKITAISSTDGQIMACFDLK